MSRLRRLRYFTGGAEMYTRILAYIVTLVALVAMTGCSVTFHPGKLTIGGEPVYATGRTSILTDSEHVTGRDNNIKFSSVDNRWYETYTLSNGDICTRSWSEGSSVRNAPGKRYDYSSNRYTSDADCKIIVSDNAEEFCFIPYTLRWDERHSRSFRSERDYVRNKFSLGSIRPICQLKPKK